MKRLFMAAAALTIAVATAPSYVGSSEAASARNRASAATPDWGPGSQYCKLSSFQRNAPSWNQHYGCLKTSQRPAVERAAAPAPTRTAAAASDWGPGSQYCKLSSFQRNAPSWNQHYGCLKTSQRPAPAPIRVAAAGSDADWGPGSQYCKLASFQRNAPSWNQHYGCLRY